MFTLIKREIQDNLILFLGAAITATVFVIVIVLNVVLKDSYRPPVGIPPIMNQTFGYLLPFLSLAAAALGAIQMRADKNVGISAFLSTLATTRQRILTARIIAGLLWILVVISPIVLADVILLRVFPRVAPLDIDFFVKMIATMFLSCLACYALGLQIGWNANIFVAVFGSIVISPVLISVIIIKGFGIQTMVILLLFVAAFMVRTWQKFMSTPL